MLLFVGGMLALSNQYVQAEPSSYSKKVQEIKEKYYSLFKYGTVKGLTYDDRIACSLLGSTAIDIYYAQLYLQSNSSQQKALDNYYAKYKKEMKEAENLLTDAEKEEIKRLEFKKSAYGQLVIPIFDKLTQFAQKGEYEKTADYEQRMKTQLLDSAMLWCAALKNMHAYVRVENVSSLYDADNEIATLKIKIKRQNWVDYSQIKVPLPIEVAKNLEGFDNFNTYRTDYKKYCLTNVLKLQGYDIYPDSIRFLLNGEKYTVNAPANMKLTDMIVDLSEIETAGKYLKGYGYNVTKKHPIISKDAKDQITAKVIAFNTQLDTMFQQINSRLLVDPYNVKKIIFTEKDINMYKLNANDYYNMCSVEKRMQQIITEINEDEKEGYKRCRGNLQYKNPEKYLEITYTLNPDLQKYVGRNYRFYSCHYSESQYVMNLLDSVDMIGDCREKYFEEYKHLFESKNQFDNVFDTTHNWSQEIARREEAKKLYEMNKDLFMSKMEFDNIFYSNQEISTEIDRRRKNKLYEEYKEIFNNREDFDSTYNSTPNILVKITERQDLYKKLKQFQTLICYEKKTPNGSSITYGEAGVKNFQGVNSLPEGKIDTPTMLFLSMLSEMRASVYSERAIKYLIDWNKILSKEYSKVEQYFNGYWDFWDHYTSATYKQYVKTQKNKK